jgi:hypothetical protein
LALKTPSAARDKHRRLVGGDGAQCHKDAVPVVEDLGPRDSLIVRRCGGLT